MGFFQDYDAMVQLVTDLDSVNAKVTDTVAIQHLYAFALNRRNQDGDRVKALSVIHKVLTIKLPLKNQSLKRY